jgi:hypothetical protein
MRWRVIVLAALAAVLTAITGFCVWKSGELINAGSHLYETATDGQLSQKLAETASRLYQTGYALEQLITPLAIGAIVCGLSVLVVLARRWQLDTSRDSETVAAP